MDNFNKQSEIRNTKIQSDETMTRRVMIIIFGAVEIILGFRFFFKLMGANPENTFVKIIYDVTQFIVGIFASIFSVAINEGAETNSIFEPGTLIAMVIIALIAWGIARMMNQRTDIKTNKTVYTENES
jgi:hypothetical protein